MVELSADEEAFVMIEGIEMMTEYLTVLKKVMVEADYVTNIDKMLKKASDPLTADEIRIRMAKLVGKILDRFAHFMLANQYKDMFIEFFKATIQDKVFEVRLGLVYNLPCFNFIFKDADDSLRAYFE